MKDDRLVLALECDLQSEYGVDLRDLWRPGSGLTLRRLISLLKGLPPTSRFMKIRGGLKDEEYDSKEQYLLHHILDGLRQVIFFTQVTAMANVDKKNSKKVMKNRPEPLPLPGEEQKKEEKKFNTTADLVRALGKRARVVASTKDE